MQDHTRPQMSIAIYSRPFKANTEIQYHNFINYINLPQKITLCSRMATKAHSTLYSSKIVLHSFSNFFLFHYEDFFFAINFVPFWNFLFAHISCSIRNIFCSQTFFVPFGTFFAQDSTPPITTTTKLLLGPLSIARGQKEDLL